MKNKKHNNFFYLHPLREEEERKNDHKYQKYVLKCIKSVYGIRMAQQQQHVMQHYALLK